MSGRLGPDRQVRSTLASAATAHTTAATNARCSSHGPVIWLMARTSRVTTPSTTIISTVHTSSPSPYRASRRCSISSTTPSGPRSRATRPAITAAPIIATHAGSGAHTAAHRRQPVRSAVNARAATSASPTASQFRHEPRPAAAPPVPRSQHPSSPAAHAAVSARYSRSTKVARTSSSL